MAELDYRALLEGLPDAIIAADLSDHIVYVNAAATTLLLRSRESLFGAHLTTLMPTRLRPAHEAGFQRYRETRRPRILGRPVRVPALRGDGSEIEVELTLSAFEFEQGTLLVAALRDLRDRVELERQLGANRRITAQYEVMRLLAETTTLEQSAPRLLEALGTQLEWDAATMFVPNEERSTLTAIATWLSAPAFEEFAKATLAMRFARGEGLPGRVWTNGEVSWVRDVTAADNFPRREVARRVGLRGGFAFALRVQKEIVGVVELFTREVREADEELMRTADSIGGSIGQVVRRLRAEQERERLLGELKQAIRVRDEFLSVASHELKTPLTPLLLKFDSLERLLVSPPQDLVTPLRSTIEMGRRQVMRLNALIADLLDVSRIQAGRLRIEKENVNLSALVAEIVARHQEHAAAVGSTLEARIDPDIIAHLDRGRVEQILVNLIDNAVKYGRGKPVDVSLRRQDAEAVIAVRDRGIGIEAMDLNRIFERFERAVSERNYGGLGLGLYITRSLVEAMGGNITVESVPGEGASFRVSLPVALDPTKAKTATE